MAAILWQTQRLEIDRTQGRRFWASTFSRTCSADKEHFIPGGASI
jgi:hypothetical protein